MELNFTESEGTLRVAFVGELDECAAGSARESIDNLLRKDKYSKVVFDMSRLNFMDSTGIGVLVGRFKRYGKNAAFFVSSPTNSVDKILKLSGIYTLMPKII